MDDRNRLEQLEKSVQSSVVGGRSAPSKKRLRGDTRRQTRAVLSLVLGWVFIAWIWSSRPTWIFGDQAAPPTIAQREASLRYALFLQRGEIDGFVEEMGTLPESQEELGEPEEGISWERRGRGFVITGRDEGLSLMLTDQMDADSFLGNSLNQLR